MRQLPLIFVATLIAQSGAAELVVRSSTPEIEHCADWKLAPLDGAPGVELFVVTREGVLETFSFAKRDAGPTRAKTGRIADAAHCALALEVLQTDSKTGLFVASPRGVERLEPDATGSFEGAAVLLAPRAKMTVRTGRPTFAPLAVDVNGDGRTDVIVPKGNALEVWVQNVATGAGSDVEFAKVATVQVRVSSSESTDAGDLSDDLESSLQIPSLHLADVNGDGRDDLLVEDGQKRAFHLVRVDGSIPAVPDVSVDLAIFKDTTARGELTLGRTLAGSDKAVYESRDLDADGIPDAVIAQGRKVWVFHGSKAGPQFTEPSNVLKAADDVTAAMVLKLDDDERPDLLLVRVVVPSLGTILRGLVSSWEIEMNAVGYQNSGERKFDTTPKWKSRITFTVPSILSIAKDPEKLLTRFEGVGKKFRLPAEGDFDGDGAADVALVSEDATTLDVWRGSGAASAVDDDANDQTLRRVLFEDENRAWDLDRLVAWLSSFGEQRVALVTGGREPNARHALRSKTEWRLASLAPGDVDGDGKSEIVLSYEALDGSGRAVFDVVAWK
ncbi:MAG: VCBS repeat-containing protein [Planctomycetota bacterium]|nr:VCBS repeat-containing protein [Planctomycetota bacterium]